jgi:GR25 family glycosyltransferase involved in LPS biosynthesis
MNDQDGKTGKPTGDFTEQSILDDPSMLADKAWLSKLIDDSTRLSFSSIVSGFAKLESLLEVDALSQEGRLDKRWSELAILLEQRDLLQEESRTGAERRLSAALTAFQEEFKVHASSQTDRLEDRWSELASVLKKRDVSQREAEKKFDDAFIQFSNFQNVNQAKLVEQAVLNEKLQSVLNSTRKELQELAKNAKALDGVLLERTVDLHNSKAAENYLRGSIDYMYRWMTFRLGSAIIKNIKSPFQWLKIPRAIIRSHKEFKYDKANGRLARPRAPLPLSKEAFSIESYSSLIKETINNFEMEIDYKGLDLLNSAQVIDVSLADSPIKASSLETGKKLPLFAVCVTTWNRIDYITKFVDSFLMTRSSLFRWALIIADDGSVDGTLNYLDELSIPDCQIIIIRNKNKTIAGQSNALMDAAKVINFDFGVMCNDDIFFIKPGWDSLYYSATLASDYGHLVYHNEDWKPAAFKKEKGRLESFVSAIDGMGCFYTFTPRILEEVGYFDVHNFPFRGHSHMDFTQRCCRLGFNELDSLWDAKSSETYISMWQRDQYKETVDWSSEKVKRILNPEERVRRMSVVEDASREYIALEKNVFLEVPVVVTCKPKSHDIDSRINQSMLFRSEIPMDRIFDAVFVLNLRHQKNRWSKMASKLSKLGIHFERFEAVNGNSPEHVKAWEDYSAKGLEHPVEKDIGRKLIQSPGAWGYLHSMLELLKSAKERRLKRIVVFDDDILFHNDFTERFFSTWHELPSDWRLVYLGCNHTDRSVIRPYSDSFYHPESKANGSFAYAIDESVFDLLITEIEKFEWPYDAGPLRVVNTTHPDKTFVIEPNLVIANVTESTIRGSRDQEKFALEAGWNLENYEAALPMEDKSGLVGKFVQLTVCIIVTKDSESLSAVLHSIRQQTFGDFELILVLDEQVSVEMHSQLELFVAQDTRLKSIYQYDQSIDAKGFWLGVLDGLEGGLVFVNDRCALSPDYLEVDLVGMADTNARGLCRDLISSCVLNEGAIAKLRDYEKLLISCVALRKEFSLVSIEKSSAANI